MRDRYIPPLLPLAPRMQYTCARKEKYMFFTPHISYPSGIRSSHFWRSVPLLYIFLHNHLKVQVTTAFHFKAILILLVHVFILFQHDLCPEFLNETAGGPQDRDAKRNILHFRQTFRGSGESPYYFVFTLF